MSKNKFTEPDLISEENAEEKPVVKEEKKVEVEKPARNAISVRVFLSNNVEIRQYGKYVLVAFQRYCSLESLFVKRKTEKEWIAVYEKFAKRKVG